MSQKYIVLELDLMRKINNSVKRIIDQYQADDKELPDKLLINVDHQPTAFIVYPKDIGKLNFDITIEAVNKISIEHIN